MQACGYSDRNAACVSEQASKKTGEGRGGNGTTMQPEAIRTGGDTGARWSSIVTGVQDAQSRSALPGAPVGERAAGFPHKKRGQGPQVLDPVDAEAQEIADGF
ncbi:fructose-bisphosphate aldolase [Sagittula stellata E-37]|uniref:Fructose-bisphosphate aldolase n=1 Tax=Sagittula stellata (strain ATCC 700073 / DSM 11524 / E-37) TaxID=388399 RepID=A3JZ12_SAGS3|nr:fructose-bisphosphate aldolase [Sagittula stellata E-37]